MPLPEMVLAVYHAKCQLTCPIHHVFRCICPTSPAIWALPYKISNSLAFYCNKVKSLNRVGWKPTSKHVKTWWVGFVKANPAIDLSAIVTFHFSYLGQVLLDHTKLTAKDGSGWTLWQQRHPIFHPWAIFGNSRLAWKASNISPLQQ